MRGRSSTAASPTGMTLGEYLADRRFGPRVPRPLPDPDHRRGLVDGARSDARVPGRLPAPLPRQPRAHRARPGAPVADGDRRLAHATSTGCSRRCPPGTVRSGDPVTAVTRDEAGATVRTAAGAPRAVRCASSWRRTPTRRWRCSATPTPAERAALGGFEYNRNQVVLHTDARVDAAPPRRLGVVERRPGRVRPARARPSR